jgi:ribonuclease R
VHLSSVPEDFFVFDESRNQLVGRRTRRVVKMGDKVMVCVYKVDQFKKQVDFQWKTGNGKPEGRKAEVGRPKAQMEERKRGRSRDRRARRE